MKKKRKYKRSRKKFKKISPVLSIIGFLLAIALWLESGLELPGLGTDQSPDQVVQKGALEIHYLDVGQGDCTLIKSGGQSMLIDAGENDQGTKIQNYLEKQGIEKLDYVIGTHPDSDHIGGMDVILTKFECGIILMPEDTKDTRTWEDVELAMEYKGYAFTKPVPGEVYTLGEAEFTVIAPQKMYEDSNNNSVGILLTHGSQHFLFTADAEEEAEKDILASGISLSAEVYKAGHHGSKTASSPAFLDAVDPKYAVISCAEGNSYGHPHAAVLNEFRERGIKIFRTDEQGTLVVTSDGLSLTWNVPPSESFQSGN